MPALNLGHELRNASIGLSTVEGGDSIDGPHALQGRPDGMPSAQPIFAQSVMSPMSPPAAAGTRHRLGGLSGLPSPGNTAMKPAPNQKSPISAGHNKSTFAGTSFKTAASVGGGPGNTHSSFMQQPWTTGMASTFSRFSTKRASPLQNHQGHLNKVQYGRMLARAYPDVFGGKVGAGAGARNTKLKLATGKASTYNAHPSSPFSNA